ncbi:hypothetical protein [Aeoliella mucimassa]|uniref:Uncharacterized protein n=1 Tax=Aeoliella mucimassa TaxID=2527972 RepID=A0A518AGX2_9BACT|nr:hypothetical protein [Aeoliella mucimassa]QDU53980.1 hypothetical protein Pan181_01590 [Aeoliella mucimassa]
MPFLFQPVLADLALLIKVIFLLVIMASGIVRWIREAKQPPAPPQRPGRRPARDPLDDPMEHDERPRRQPQQEEIRSEVEEFLRRIGKGEPEPGRRAQPVEARQTPPAAGSRRPRQIEMIDETGFGVDDRPRQTHRRTPPQQAQPKPLFPPVPSTPPRQGIERGESVAEHVAVHLNEDQFRERATHLGEDVAQSDERLEAHLHQTFDHGLGSLAARRKVREQEDAAKRTAEEAPNLAETLLGMLSSPAGVQQAVILNEVLRRPDDRF